MRSNRFRCDGIRVALALLDDGLELCVDGYEKKVTLWRDVLGATVEGLALTIYMSPCKNNGQRTLEKIVMDCDDEALCKQFKVAICYCATHLTMKSLCVNEILHLSDVERKYLILINPVGGTGNAQRIFEQVQDFFTGAGITTVVQLTERAGHATDLAYELNLTSYECIVCVGGDGLMSEVVQGLMKRKDWFNAIRIPLGIIPGGSGNGLAKSIVKLVGEEFFPENCAYVIAKGSPQPIDMMTTRNGSDTFTSFLSLAWAFIADVDLNSESYRYLGSLRFTVSAVAKVLSYKRWYGSLSYLPANDSTPISQYNHENKGALAPCLLPPLTRTSSKTPKGWKTIKGPFSFFWATSAAYPSSDCLLAPQANLNDGFVYMVMVPENVSLITQAKILLSLENGQHIDYPQVQVIKTRAYELRRDDCDFVSVDGERLNGGTIQVEVHRGLGRIMSLSF